MLVNFGENLGDIPNVRFSPKRTLLPQRNSNIQGPLWRKVGISGDSLTACMSDARCTRLSEHVGRLDATIKYQSTTQSMNAAPILVILTLGSESSVSSINKFDASYTSPKSSISALTRINPLFDRSVHKYLK